MVLTVCLGPLIAGCSIKPQSNYDVGDPIQVTTDLLKDTRHFNVTSDYNPSYLDSLLKRNPVTLIDDQDWQQLFIKTEFSSDKSYRLEENLRRTCWSLNNEAELKIVSRAHRGSDYDNIITACVSKRLGPYKPLFFYSQVQDRVIGDYLMMLTPKNHYSDQAYLCKAKTEGYDLPSNLFCKVNSQ